MAPTERGGRKKKSCSAIDEMVTGDYTPPFTSTSVEWASIVFSSGSQRKPEIGHEGDGDSRCVHQYQSQESHLGQRDRECRKHKEEEDSPNKLDILVTFVPITTFSQSMWMRTNLLEVK